MQTLMYEVLWGYYERRAKWNTSKDGIYGYAMGRGLNGMPHRIDSMGSMGMLWVGN